MNSTRFQLIEKLRQSKLTAALNRSKAVTKSATPFMDEVMRLAKERNISCDDLSADWIAGKTSLPTLDLILAAKTTASAAAKPHGLAAAASAAKPTTAKPAPVRGILEQFAAICKHGDLSARVAFFNKHSAALKRAQAKQISNPKN